MAHSLGGSHWVYTLTRHAQERMKERGLCDRDIRFIVAHGVLVYQKSGYLSYYIPDSPFACLGYDGRQLRLAGSEVVIDPHKQKIVTVQWRYKDDDGACLNWGPTWR